MPESGQTEPSQPVTLSATLDGPYADVATLKSSSGNSPADATEVELTAPAIHTTTWDGGAPISRIRLPLTAAAGYDNASTSISAASSGAVSGASIIQVMNP
ncbi:MAG: hypothetical protein ABI382_11230 [Nakamurella sp.]